MISQYRRALTRFVIVIIAFLVVGIVLALLSPQLFSEEARQDVLVSALPFVALFVGILLTFILFIVLVMLRLSGVVAQRAYRPIEYIIMAGIVIGIVGMFQPARAFGYEYGFVILLGSTLAFTVWSHVTPKSAGEETLPPLTMKDHLIGLNSAVLVWFIFVVVLAVSAAPVAPYGLGKSVWGMMDDAARTEAAAAAQWEYYNVKLPYFAVLNILPAAAAYIAVRELAASSNAPLPAGSPEAHPA